MDISLIICTRNRGTKLRACLAAVGQLEYAGAWELILIDNGSSDETPDVMKEFARSAAIPVKIIFHQVPGLGGARNVGIAHSGGSILAFTDDDCYVTPAYLENIERAFADPSMGYVGGRIMLFDTTDFPVSINESTRPWRKEPRQYVAAGAITGANMAFRRDALLRIGGFDEQLGSGTMLASAEDTDAAARASIAGWRGQYCPDIVVYHHHGRKKGDVGKLQKDYAIGRGAYHAKLLLTGAWQQGLKGWCGIPWRIRGFGVSQLFLELKGAFLYLQTWAS